jgi:DNA polymerase III delta prime subunit
MLVIKSFEVKNQGPIKYVRCESVPPIMIIAGPNGVGKSTLLESIWRGQGARVEGLKERPIYISPHRAPTPFPLHKSLPAVSPRRRLKKMLEEESFSIGAPGISLPYWIASPPPRSRKTADLVPYAGVKYRLAQFYQEFKDALADIYTERGEVPRGFLPDIWQPFKRLIESLLPGIRFEGIKVEGDVLKVSFKNRLGEPVEFDDLSSGEKDVIALLFPLVERQVENELAIAKGARPPHEEFVVLVDSPEAYLHPALQRRFLEYVRELVKIEEAELQFIIATHSTTMISMANAQELYALVFPDQAINGNQLIRVASDDEKLSLARDVLGDVALILAGRALLLVEGPSDADLLALLKPELKEKFTIKDLGGKSRVKGLVSALKEVMSELRKRGFKMFAIVDKDVGLPETDPALLTWPVHCIENFLLNPEAIYEALKIIAGNTSLESRGVKSKEDVERIIDEVIKDPEIIELEVKERIRDRLKFYYGDDWSDFSELEQKVLEATNKRLEKIKEDYHRIKDELSRLASDKVKALREFDGKIIFAKVVKKLGVDVDSKVLIREVAEKIRILRRAPPQLEELLHKLITNP